MFGRKWTDGSVLTSNDASRGDNKRRTSVYTHTKRSHTRVKHPVVHVMDQWFMKTLKHPACTAGWLARLCRSWLSQGKAIRIPHGRNHNGTIQL